MRYSVNQKETVPLLFLQYLWFLLINFKFFFPSQSEMIVAHIWNKVCHLTLIMLQHYICKREQVQL